MITVKVGYECGDNLDMVEFKEFNSFDEANKWSSDKMVEEGYDTAEFEHCDGEEVMREIIMNHLKEQESKQIIRILQHNKKRKKKFMKKVSKKLGRPVNPNSARQLRLKELELKRANGELKRGRPVDPNSVRQSEIERKKFNKEFGIELRGRKVNPNSARQIRLAELELKRQNGTLKRGRPSMVSKLEDKINSGELFNNSVA